MRLAVVIASTGRPDMLARTVGHLMRQIRLPDEIVISAAQAADVQPLDDLPVPVKVVYGSRGLCAQRNRGLAVVLPAADIVTFIDDDFLPATTYLARLEDAFSENPDFNVIHGFVFADGAQTAGYSFEEGVRLLGDRESLPEPEVRVDDHVGAYGCNMSVRASAIGDVRFDERLPLYGWQEDIDFSASVGRGGRIVSISTLSGVHLGVKSGRVSGTRFGYSQIVNPLYLVRKGTMPLYFATKLMSRNIVANLVKVLRPEPWIDRRGRLYGNILGIWHVMRGHIEPERIVKL